MRCYSATKEPENSLIEKVEKLSALKAEQLQALYTWMTAIRLVTQFNHPDLTIPNADFLTPEDFYSLRPDRQNQLRQQIPQLKHIESLVNRQYLNELEDRVKKTKVEVETLQKKLEPDAVKSLFQSFHKEQLDLKYADLDPILGLDYEATEKLIDRKKYPLSEAWVGAPKFQTQTDYMKIKRIFNLLSLNKNDVFYDLGSGYGRVIFYGSLNYPETTFKGVEFVHERVKAANKITRRHQIKNAQFIARDVLQQDLSDGTIFYIFNSFPSIMPEVLKNLKKVAGTRTIRIVAVGRTALELKHVDWLKVESRLERNSAFDDVMIYSSEYQK